MNGSTPKIPRTRSVGARNSQPTDCDRMRPPPDVLSRSWDTRPQNAPWIKTWRAGAPSRSRPGNELLGLTVAERAELLLGRLGHLVERVRRAELAGDRLIEERRRRFTHLRVERERRCAAEELSLVLHQRVVVVDLAVEVGDLGVVIGRRHDDARTCRRPVRLHGLLADE